MNADTVNVLNFYKLFSIIVLTLHIFFAFFFAKKSSGTDYHQSVKRSKPFKAKIISRWLPAVKEKGFKRNISSSDEQKNDYKIVNPSV